MQELKKKLNNPQTRKRKKEALESEIGRIMKGEQCDHILKVALHEQGNGRFDLTWDIVQIEYQWFTESYFGKRIITTCRQDWMEAKIIAAYQGQNHIDGLSNN